MSYLNSGLFYVQYKNMIGNLAGGLAAKELHDIFFEETKESTVKRTKQHSFWPGCSSGCSSTAGTLLRKQWCIISSMEPRKSVNS